MEHSFSWTPLLCFPLDLGKLGAIIVSDLCHGDKMLSFTPWARGHFCRNEVPSSFSYDYGVKKFNLRHHCWCPDLRLLDKAATTHSLELWKHLLHLWVAAKSLALLKSLPEASSVQETSQPNWRADTSTSRTALLAVLFLLHSR